MSRRVLNPPPNRNVPFLLADGNLNPIWSNWFDALWRRAGGGDSDDLSFREDSFTPTFSGLSLLGTSPSTSGRYWKNGSSLYFEVTISPNGGLTSTSSGASVTNLPFTAANTGTVEAFDCTSLTNLGSGAVQEGTTVARLPRWTNNPSIIVIRGTVKVA